MPARPLAVVVGADGFVGGALARALEAERIVYGPCHPGDTHIRDAEGLLNRADVVINCGGFRVRPGCTDADYRRAHQGSLATFVPWMRKGTRLLHVSSAAVLGCGERLGNRTVPNPDAFPSPAYARAKLEADRYLGCVAAERGLRVIFLRPAVVYAPGGEGMVGTLVKLAARGLRLRLYPRNARHHLVHIDLLAEVTRRVIEREDLPDLTCLVVADPSPVTNRELEAMIRAARPTGGVLVPLPVHWLSVLLRHTPHSRNPALDLKTKGEVFGVLAMDTVYDASDTFRVLEIDPSRYTLEKTLQPLIAASLRE